MYSCIEASVEAAKQRETYVENSSASGTSEIECITGSIIMKWMSKNKEGNGNRRTEKEVKSSRTREIVRQGKEAPWMMGWQWVIKYLGMREEERQGEKDLHLFISVVILSSPFISLHFLFLRLYPHLSLTLSPPCSFLMLSPLTPLGSLSFPAFSCCFIYSLRCICSSFLLPCLSFPASFTISLRLIHSFSSKPPLFVHFSHQLSVSPSLV